MPDRTTLEQCKVIAAFAPTDACFPETDPRHPKNKRAPQFKAEEVWAVARAVLDHAIDNDVDRGRSGAYNECKHCDERVWWEAPHSAIVHKPDCLVLIARDLLTGAPDA